MDMLKQMNAAIQYIEDNLNDEIDYKKIAKTANYSEFHFKRMFSILSGITLSEYIRKRRLTLAGFDLKHLDMKVIDVAIKYGYSSADSFTRAFQSLHGITPSEARDDLHVLKAFPRMTFLLTIEGGSEMNYRIVEKEAFRIVGISKRVPIIFHGENPEITAMWKTLTIEKINQLKAISNIEPFGIIQASTNFSEGRMEEKGSLDHFIGVATNNQCPKEFVQLEVPASSWAVFETEGPFPNTLQDTWGRIYAEWFPSVRYQQVEGPEILSIKTKDLTSPAVKCEIWIPVLLLKEID